MSESTLITFGPSFQSKVISALLVDQPFLQTIYDILEPKIFDSDSNKWLVKTIKNYFIQYKTTPTLEALKVEIDAITDETYKLTVISSLQDVWKYRESTDLQYVKDQILKFCKNQSLKQAIFESVELLERGNYDEVKVRIDNAIKAGTEKDFGHIYIEGIEERLTKSVRYTLQTPWDIMNELFDGGLAKGELGVIIAPPGIGKTWCLQTIGAHSIKQGFTVLHYTLELNQNYVGLRYDTIISGIPTSEIKHYKDDVRKKVEAIPGKLYIKYYPTRSATVQTISAHIEQLKMQGIEPDLVIVDYGDILKPMTVFKEKRHGIGNNYEELRGLAGEFNIPVWTASQANRSALEEDIIDATKVSEDFSKIMTADVVMSISRKVEDKVSNTARCHLIKNRFGPDGLTMPMNMNTTKGQIEIYEGNTQQGREQSVKMNDSNEFLRKSLKNKYDNLEGFD